jgi:hypothetical protein
MLSSGFIVPNRAGDATALDLLLEQLAALHNNLRCLWALL